MSEDLFSKALQDDGLEVELPKLDQNDMDNITVDEAELEEDRKEIDTGSKSHWESESDSDSDSESEESSASSDASSDNESNDEIEDDIEEENMEGPIKSKHETLEEESAEIPADYQISETTVLKSIGTIKSLYNNNVIVETSTSGENRVLKDGSIFCLSKEKKLLGRLVEVFGKLTSPLYRVLLPKDADMSEWKEKVGEDVSIIVSDSAWVDTFMIRKFKGTDASNAFDEELPESEQEFSDDEKEMNYKKMKKQQRKSNKNENNATKKVQKPNANNNSNRRNIPKSQHPATRFPSYQAQPSNENTRVSSYKPRNSRNQNVDSSQTNYDAIQQNTTPVYPPVSQFNPQNNFNNFNPNMNMNMNLMNTNMYLNAGQSISANFNTQQPQMYPLLGNQFSTPAMPPIQPLIYQNQPSFNNNNNNINNQNSSQSHMNQVLQLHSLLLQQQQQQQQQQQTYTMNGDKHKDNGNSYKNNNEKSNFYQ
ncbi:hypothetical protein TPHA_0I01460 [Tetrapisispora phaffii CBS 4417]|uniref:H/ACA ribonucleoprotein complex non-core subunit NAF1 n=1 Tax=Tetrapisispora phaffii (strain ATCC 24235 / CBS 4417 / NBRC 1672 / NRRL Y-8282 / UCD 70-5) TaxID=1071381 RepID=G8BXM4_TETPH|nr:hypothetical protein TPHA_0I01460 [Tetrapisispora phaffii CBS 4417]CCE64652.1 hypothetical protein TPHA_0I01460 [Tetrapisispora phaffii CBS 4417]